MSRLTHLDLEVCQRTPREGTMKKSTVIIATVVVVAAIAGMYLLRYTPALYPLGVIAVMAMVFSIGESRRTR